mmetsp:Transcript_29106/g.61789  ORF Transcript_29106/g.61789 Transcript_29106/m.61789 type:complete len:424 (-) Transcript_29106:190-1461(-)
MLLVFVSCCSFYLRPADVDSSSSHPSAFLPSSPLESTYRSICHIIILMLLSNPPCPLLMTEELQCREEGVSRGYPTIVLNLAEFETYQPGTAISSSPFVPATILRHREPLSEPQSKKSARSQDADPPGRIHPRLHDHAVVLQLSQRGHEGEEEGEDIVPRVDPPGDGEAHGGAEEDGSSPLLLLLLGLQLLLLLLFGGRGFGRRRVRQRLGELGLVDVAVGAGLRRVGRGGDEVPLLVDRRQFPPGGDGPPRGAFLRDGGGGRSRGDRRRRFRPPLPPLELLQHRIVRILRPPPHAGLDSVELLRAHAPRPEYRVLGPPPRHLPALIDVGLRPEPVEVIDVEVVRLGDVVRRGRRGGGGGGGVVLVVVFGDGAQRRRRGAARRRGGATTRSGMAGGRLASSAESGTRRRRRRTCLQTPSTTER